MYLTPLDYVAQDLAVSIIMIKLILISIIGHYTSIYVLCIMHIHINDAYVILHIILSKTFMIKVRKNIKDNRIRIE